MKKRKYLFIILGLFFFSITAQNKIEYKPDYPINYKDTLLVINKKFTRKNSEKTISFIIEDQKWECKSIAFTYLLPKDKLRIETYDNITYKERNMDKRIFGRKDIRKYKSISLKALKQYSEENYGCNGLESYLIKPTIYFIIKENKKHVGYEVLPIVWGTRVD